MHRSEQFELQLGHLCNNRCVFCVSGQLTSKGEAPLLRLDELTKALEEARRTGRTAVTFLGGEPTIQPFFLDLVRHAVALGFERIVVFSNGSKPGRTDLVDEIAALGGNIEWRFSFQGATAEAHERTTRRRGSFAQLLRAAQRARAHGHRVTVNTCVVRQNYESLPRFADLLLPLGVSQLHVDILNPYDTGTLGIEGIFAIQPRYSELAEPLARMVAGFPLDFDVNIGNLPFCVAPALTPRIRHGGEPTWTVTANDGGSAALGAGRSKYLVKAARKVKLASCRNCALDDRCTGVFELYAEQYGFDELRPMAASDVEGIRLDEPSLAVRLAPILRTLAESNEERCAKLVEVHEPNRDEVHIEVRSPETAVTLALRQPQDSALGLADDFGLFIVRPSSNGRATLSVVEEVWSQLVRAGARSRKPPPSPDLLELPVGLQGVLSNVYRAAPLGALLWLETRRLDSGIELYLESPSGERVVAWIRSVNRRIEGGYRLEGDVAAPSPELIEGLQAFIRAVRAQPRREQGDGAARWSVR